MQIHWFWSLKPKPIPQLYFGCCGEQKLGSKDNMQLPCSKLMN